MNEIEKEIAKILDSLCCDIPDEICKRYSCSECKAIQIYKKVVQKYVPKKN